MAITTISGGTFSFSTTGYTAPTWSGSTYSMGTSPTYFQWVDVEAQWVEDNELQWVDLITTATGILNQIWTDDYYVYAATTLGLRIIDIVSESEYAYINYSFGFNTVWANDDKVYLGSAGGGIKYINKTCISGSTVAPYDLSTCLNDFSFAYSPSSSIIRYLHGHDTDYLLCVTDTEVDVFKFGGTIYKSSSTTVSGNAYKGFMTSTGKFYYTLSGTEWSVERVDRPQMDWTTSNASHAAGGAIIGSGRQINDIFVTEQTSSDGSNNTLFLATSSGVYVIDEGTNDYAVYYTTTASGG